MILITNLSIVGTASKPKCKAVISRYNLNSLRTARKFPALNSNVLDASKYIIIATASTAKH